MALESQIDRAALVEKRPIGQIIDRAAVHILGGATARDPAEEARAARLLWRAAPDQDLADMLDLTPPPLPATAADIVGHDVLEVLLRELRHGEAAARAFAADLPKERAKAAKRELARRRSTR
ncbi:MAG: hypothetical protein IRZ07_29860 [Microbispora sp.]|nr:hypothetical protein [Microbispora sp.]